MILESVNLRFDPQNAGEVISEIFKDDLARALWLGIRQGHLIDQDFHRNILRYSQTIKREKSEGKLDSRRLFDILSGFAKPPACGVIGPNEQTFAEELLPFINGEKSIAFTIVR